MKKVYLVILSFIMMFGVVLSPVDALTVSAKDIVEDDLYHIVDHRTDGTMDDKKQTASLKNAEELYQDALKTSRNPGIYYQGKILKIRYGIVTFKREATCSYNVNYTNLMNGQSGYTNGCYGADAAYISTGEDYNSVAFMISGVGGRASMDDVEIIPLEQVNQLSDYTVKNNELYHNIKTSLSSKGYGSSIVLDKAPEYLEEGNTYYSYDGHSFYLKEDVTKMIDDIRNGNDEQAINKGNPYYNYYQYLPHRSTSSYQSSEIEDYLLDKQGVYRGIRSYSDMDGDGLHDVWTQSLLADSASSFLEYQNIYGSNALMMIALAMNESAMGRSSIGYQKNNLFGHAAYDSSAQESASRYDQVSQSIYSHAKHYISGSYLNPKEYMYHGGFFGDKQSGMNVSYASDPYWGEKAASYMYRMDKAMGQKDRNQYTLGIHTTFDDVLIYASPKEEAKVLYETKGTGSMSFIILKSVKNKDGTWFQIQSEPVVKKQKDDDLAYHFGKNIGYIKKDTIDVLMKKDKTTSNTYRTITFDGKGGSFENGSKQIKQYVKVGMLPSVNAPVKKNMYFTGWKETISEVKKDKTYHAQYQKIKKLSWIKKPKTDYIVDDQLDVSDASIKMTLQDGKGKKILLTTDMVYDYHLDKAGKQELSVKVGGASLKYSIQVQESDKKKEKVNQAVINMVDQYHKKVVLSGDAKKEILDVKKQVNQLGEQFFTITDLRSMDKLFQRALGNDLKVNLKTYDKKIGVSGLSVLAKLNKQESVITFDIKKQGDGDAKKLLETITKDNSLSVNQYHKITIQNNDKELTNLDTQVVVSLPKPTDTKKSDQYVVLYSDGTDVIKMPIMQTKNRIIFKIDRTGTFVLAHRSNVAVSSVDDVSEVTTTDKETIPWLKITVITLVVLTLLFIIVLCVLRIRHKRKRKRL